MVDALFIYLGWGVIGLGSPYLNIGPIGSTFKALWSHIKRPIGPMVSPYLNIGPIGSTFKALWFHIKGLLVLN
jgi:hypothetical protein